MQPLSSGIGAETEVIDAWPCCPRCGRRRMTRCPFCGTSGSDFPPADANAGDLLGLPTPPDGAYSSCGCGPSGCGMHGDEADQSSKTASATASSLLLICPTCDEPFHPEYLRRCEWCGHIFPDGTEIPLPDKQTPEPINWRIAYVLYVLVLLAIGLASYLWWMF